MFISLFIDSFIDHVFIFADLVFRALLIDFFLMNISLFQPFFFIIEKRIDWYIDLNKRYEVQHARNWNSKIYSYFNDEKYIYLFLYLYLHLQTVLKTML